MSPILQQFLLNDVRLELLTLQKPLAYDSPERAIPRTIMRIGQVLWMVQFGDTRQCKIRLSGLHILIPGSLLPKHPPSWTTPVLFVLLAKAFSLSSSSNFTKLSIILSLVAQQENNSWNGLEKISYWTGRVEQMQIFQNLGTVKSTHSFHTNSYGILFLCFHEGYRNYYDRAKELLHFIYKPAVFHTQR